MDKKKLFRFRSKYALKFASDWAGDKQEISEITALIPKLHTTAVMLERLLPTVANTASSQPFNFAGKSL